MEDSPNLKPLNAHISKKAGEYGLVAFAHVVDKKASDVSTAGPHVEITVSNMKGPKPLERRSTVTMRYFKQANTLTLFDDFIRDAARELSAGAR